MPENTYLVRWTAFQLAHKRCMTTHKTSLEDFVQGIVQAGGGSLMCYGCFNYEKNGPFSWGDDALELEGLPWLLVEQVLPFVLSKMTAVECTGLELCPIDTINILKNSCISTGLLNFQIWISLQTCGTVWGNKWNIGRSISPNCGIWCHKNR